MIVDGLSQSDTGIKLIEIEDIQLNILSNALIVMHVTGSAHMLPDEKDFELLSKDCPFRKKPFRPGPQEWRCVDVHIFCNYQSCPFIYHLFQIFEKLLHNNRFHLTENHK